jgi:hypothetical protein
MVEKIIWSRNAIEDKIRITTKDHHPARYKIIFAEIRVLHLWDSIINPDCLETDI